MASIFQLGKFPDGRIKLIVRLVKDSNLWINDLEYVTWVPTNEEVKFLTETLDMVNEHNEIKRQLTRGRLNGQTS